jgi:hypothetical protein
MALADTLGGLGGHNFRTWDRELPPSLVWLSRRLSPAWPLVLSRS